MDRRCHQLHHQVPYDGNQVPYSAATLLAAFLQKPGSQAQNSHTINQGKQSKWHLVDQSKELTII